MPRIRTVFAGTPEFAVPSLQGLIDHPAVDLVGIYTQPDRPAGRGRRLTASPVKRLALAHGLALYQPDTLRSDAACAQFAALAPALLVVAAYGLILPAVFLDVPRHAINVHASLLPRWRGAAPIQRAILAGDSRTGISIMRIVQQLDAGPVWLQRSCTIAAHDTGGTLHDKLAALGTAALGAALDLLTADRIEELAQNESDVTYASKISAADRDIDWTGSAPAIERQIRALAPAPGARCRLGRIEVKVLASVSDTALSNTAPGSIVSKDASGIGVACGTGVLRLTELQPAGKQRMNAAAFLNGYGEQL